VLRDVFVRGKYRDVILPMVVLRRLDAVLEPTKPAVLTMKASLDKAGIEGFQARLEAEFWELTQRLLVLGTSVVLEWGFWARSERDEKREAARTLGVAVELRFLDEPYEELVRRVVARHAAGGVAITESHMERYRGIFQPPTDDELALYDPPLPESN